MQNAARPSDWLPRAALIVLGVTAARLGLLWFHQIELFVDEAQYWFWGQSLDFGYYSKPPLIAWVLRASTEIGSDAAFWVRAPGALCHGAVALILGAVAAHMHGARAAVWTAALWITLPMVTVGSLLAATDTVMMPWLALALLAWLKTAATGSLRWAALAGAALGVAFLGKYAAIYYVICAPIAALVTPQARVPWRAAGVAFVAFLVAISPNVLWNLANGLSTVEHTLDNADWVRDPGGRAQLNYAGLGEFFGLQFVVFGPVTFAGLIWAALRGRWPVFLAFSIPVLAIVCGQALLSEAYPNWAVAAYVAGLLAVVPWLLAISPIWRWGTLALHGAFAAFISVATVVGTGWTVGPEDRLMLARYLGRAEMSETLMALAEAQQLPLVADDRDVLADLFYRRGARAIAVYARPEAGRPKNHYVQTQSMPETVEGAVLLATRRSKLPQACGALAPLQVIAPERGAYRDRPHNVFIADAACLRP